MAYGDQFRFEMALRDNNARQKQISFPTAALLAAPAVTTVLDAINGVVDGVIREYAAVNYKVDSTLNFSNDVDCDSSHRWLVLYHDNVTLGQYRWSIPTAQADLRTVMTDELDILTVDSAGAKLKAALEANMKSPNGNAITVDRVIYVD